MSHDYDERDYRYDHDEQGKFFLRWLKRRRRHLFSDLYAQYLRSRPTAAHDRWYDYFDAQWRYCLHKSMYLMNRELNPQSKQTTQTRHLMVQALIELKAARLKVGPYLP